MNAREREKLARLERAADVREVNVPHDDGTAATHPVKYRPAVDWHTLTKTAGSRRGKDAAPGGSDHSLRNGDDFAGCSFDDAVRMARDGWIDGVRQAGALCAVAPRDVENTDMGLDVYGFIPCVPAFVASDPYCMIRHESGERRRIVLAFDCAYNCNVTTDQLLIYAQCAAQLVADLEASDADVAVYALDKTNCNGGLYVQSFTVREFGDPFDMSRMVYAFHPSFLRRVLFSYRELDAMACVAGMASDGYGSARTIDRHDVGNALGIESAAETVALPSIAEHSELCNAGKARELLTMMRATVYPPAPVEVAA